MTPTISDRLYNPVTRFDDDDDDNDDNDDGSSNEECPPAPVSGQDTHNYSLMNRLI